MPSTIPAPFTGSQAEREANYDTHHFHTYQYAEDDFETRCASCDCRPTHVAASYPCGTAPPRLEV